MLNTIIDYIPPSWILFLISGLALLFGFTRKNNNFFDFRKVFKEHFGIFGKNGVQIFIFFVVPLFLAVGIVKIKMIDKDIINNMNIVLSIFLSMLFAMLSILCSFSPKESGRTKNDNYNKLLKETFSTILFECVLCVFLLVLSFVELFVDDFCVSWQLFVASIIIYYLVLVVLMNIFVIIKRVKRMFDER